MTDQHDFETSDIKRGEDRPGSARLAKREALDESRRQKKFDAAQREAVQLQATIADFERGLLALQLSIEAELKSVWIRDPSHFAFPITARVLVARRDNLKATIAALSDRPASLVTGQRSRPEGERFPN